MGMKMRVAEGKKNTSDTLQLRFGRGRFWSTSEALEGARAGFTPQAAQ